MTKEVLSQKEKELIAVGGSVAAGCVKCSHCHFKQAFEHGQSGRENSPRRRTLGNIYRMSGWNKHPAQKLPFRRLHQRHCIQSIRLQKLCIELPYHHPET